eukprot:14228155-Alexandrium_andersonii.AAC.1
MSHDSAACPVSSHRSERPWPSSGPRSWQRSPPEGPWGTSRCKTGRSAIGSRQSISSSRMPRNDSPTQS